MSILDRYIARQFLSNFVMLLGGLLVIILVIDFSLNFDEYVEIGSKLTKESGGISALRAVGAFWDLWWPRLFQLFGFLMGLGMVAAMGFTCAQFVKNRELIAMLSGGISLHRAARPIIVCAILLTGLQVINREVIVPRLSPLLVRDKKQAGSKNLGVISQPLCTDGNGRLFYARSVNLDTNTIEGLYVWERDAAGLMTRRITADSASFSDGAWQLTHGQVTDRRATLANGRQPAPDPVARFETDLDPTALRMRRFEGYSHNLSCAQINELLERFEKLPEPPERRINDLIRTKWGRFGLMATNLLALVLCMPFFLRREPANMVVQTLSAAPVALTAIGLGFIGAVTTIPGLSPQMSVFVPALVIIPLAIAAVSNVRT
jgi:lipopolysaccharide export system permease protein